MMSRLSIAPSRLWRSFSRLSTLSALLLAFPVAAQDTAPDAGTNPQPATVTDNSMFARSGEKVLAERLSGLRFLATPDQTSSPSLPTSGMDVSRTPLLQQKDFAAVADLFLDKPVSKESLDRLVFAVRGYLQATGHSFASVYLPPQDITGGHVRIVVAEAVADTAFDVVGAQHFSEESYRAAIRQQPGKPIDQAQLEEDIAWLNRNPFREVKPTVAAGATPGATKLGLQVAEQTPWSVSLGADNTGTKFSGLYREYASLQWGNAFGRGDQLSYRYSQDPGNLHFTAHNGSYAINLPWRHNLALSGTWYRVEPALSSLFSQIGISWQIGAQYEIPLGHFVTKGHESLSFTFDYKYSDNSLLFATIPVVNNVTRIVQFGAAYSASTALAGGSAEWGASVYVSPGNFGQNNTDADFDRSRAGAKARYVYARLSARYDRPLVYMLRYCLTATAQLASSNLLGTEQFGGAGANAVRGYRENSAFGDEGVVLRNELHLPAAALAGGSLDVFGFFDAAYLHNNDNTADANLDSLGLGLNYQWRRNASVRAAFGQQMKASASNPLDRNYGHMSLILTW